MIKKAEGQHFVAAKALAGITEFTSDDAIVATDSKDKVVACVFYDVVREEITHVVGKDAKKLQSCLRRAFKEFTKLGINRVTSSVVANNEEIVDILESTGFTFTKVQGELTID